jgi:hypothetical protein
VDDRDAAAHCRLVPEAHLGLRFGCGLGCGWFGWFGLGAHRRLVPEAHPHAFRGRVTVLRVRVLMVGVGVGVRVTVVLRVMA